MLAQAELTAKIIGVASKVHSALGPGFLESVYEEALAVEFDQGGIRYQRQVVVPPHYRGRLVGEHRLDFLVEDAEVRSYLKAAGLNAGLLLNFATMPLTIKTGGA